MNSQFRTFIECSPEYQRIFLRAFLKATDRNSGWSWERLMENTKLEWKCKEEIKDA